MVYAAINASYPSASHSYNCHLLRVICVHINGGKRHAMRVQIPWTIMMRRQKSKVASNKATRLTERAWDNARQLDFSSTAQFLIHSIALNPHHLFAFNASLAPPNVVFPSLSCENQVQIGSSCSNSTDCIALLFL